MNKSNALCFSLCWILALCASRGLAQGPSSEVFGTTKENRSALIGILYDLKQTQSHEKTPMEAGRFAETIDEFLSKNWDESVLNRFFRVTRPVYTTQIFIPLIKASAAPEAFGVEKVVRPSFWLIHYKGQVAAPSDGDWRFWGWGEEACNVSVNGKNVLLANWKQVKLPHSNWTSPEGPGQKAANGALVAGDWISLRKDQVVDLDVLIGERAGGVFCSFLLIEKKGENYGPPVEGHPLLPVFQLAAYDTPQPAKRKDGPQIAQKGPVWKVVQ